MVSQEGNKVDLKYDNPASIKYVYFSLYFVGGGGVKRRKYQGRVLDF